MPYKSWKIILTIEPGEDESIDLGSLEQKVEVKTIMPGPGRIPVLVVSEGTPGKALEAVMSELKKRLKVPLYFPGSVPNDLTPEEQGRRQRTLTRLLTGLSHSERVNRKVAQRSRDKMDEFPITLSVGSYSNAPIRFERGMIIQKCLLQERWGTGKTALAVTFMCATPRKSLTPEEFTITIEKCQTFLKGKFPTVSFTCISTQAWVGITEEAKTSEGDHPFEIEFTPDLLEEEE